MRRGPDTKISFMPAMEKVHVSDISEEKLGSYQSRRKPSVCNRPLTRINHLVSGNYAAAGKGQNSPRFLQGKVPKNFPLYPRAASAVSWCNCDLNVAPSKASRHIGEKVGPFGISGEPFSTPHSENADYHQTVGKERNRVISSGGFADKLGSPVAIFGALCLVCLWCGLLLVDRGAPISGGALCLIAAALGLLCYFTAFGGSIINWRAELVCSLGKFPCYEKA